jgi:hypothetical protein
MFGVFFVLLGGYFCIFLGKKPWGHFCIFWGVFCIFWGEKSGVNFVFVGGFLSFFGEIFGFS